MFRNALLTLLAVLILAGVPTERAVANTSTALVNPTEEPLAKDDDGGCNSTAVVCIARGAIGVARGVAGDVLGGGVGMASNVVMSGVVRWAAEGAAGLLNRIAQEIDRSTRPALRSGWFQAGYAAMVQVAIALAAVFLLLAVGHAIVRQDVAILLRAISALPLALILTFTAVTLVQLALAVTDWMTASVIAVNQDGAANAFRALADLFSSGSTPLEGFVAFLMAVFMALLALAVWVELALREAAVYVAVAFMPLTFVAIVWRPTTVWCRRLAEGLLAVILSKFAIAAAFSLASGAIGQVGEGDGGGLSAIVAGGAVLLIAGLTPWILLRLLPLTQAAPDQGVSRQHVGGAMRSAPGASTASGATRMLMYGKFGAAAPLAAASVATGTQAGGGASRGAAPNDVPVAVIPEPEPRPRSRPNGSR